MKNTESKNKPIDQLIVSHLTGSISDEDLEVLNHWINTSSENRDYFNLLKDSWILSGVKSKQASSITDDSWNAFKDKSGLKENGSKSIIGGKNQEYDHFKKYFRLAASWLLVFGLGSALTWVLTDKPEKVLAAADERLIEISVPLGSKSMIRMPDSSQIWLNAGTTITYSNGYGSRNRTINLVGEAFFSVKTDSLHPFIVNTPGVVIRALGTRFNVKAYSDEKTISATLEEGKIDIRTLNMDENTKSVLLKPNDKLIYHKEEIKLKKYIESSEDQVKPEASRIDKQRDISVFSDVRTELYTSWKDARWIIDREPLGTLSPMLERRFNMKIIFTDEQLKKYKFSGTIENETIYQMLNALKLTAPLDYAIKKDTLILSHDLNSKKEFKRIMTITN